MMAFVGVSNHNFNSLFRRSFAWKAKARFVHRKFLTKYPEHEKDGIFEADPSLNKFLTTSQASVAGLKLQWAFEMDFNKDDCYQLIENYCNGGDGCLTEDVMRDACGLPVRVRRVQEEEGLGQPRPQPQPPTPAQPTPKNHQTKKQNVSVKTFAQNPGPKPYTISIKLKNKLYSRS